MAVLPLFSRDLAAGEAWKLEFGPTVRRVSGEVRQGGSDPPEFLRCLGLRVERLVGQEVSTRFNAPFLSRVVPVNRLPHPHIQPLLLPSAQLRMVGKRTCQ